MCPSDPPDSPKSISCVNKVISNERSVVLCSWGRGRNTYLWNSAALQWVWKGTLRDWEGNKISRSASHCDAAYITLRTKLSCVCCSVRTLPGNHTVGPVTSDVSNKENDLLSASFNVSTSVQLITVWVQVHNALGSAASVPVNYTLSDIGKTEVLSGVWEVPLNTEVLMQNDSIGWHKSYYN